MAKATQGNDTLTGSNGSDYLNGLKGDDWVSGGKGNDQLFGWEGDDTLYGGKGDDDIYGDDRFFFSSYGNNALFGNEGDDFLLGSEGHDTLDGGKGNDQLEGSEGDDTYLFGRGHGRDEIVDGGGNDAIVFGSGIAPADVTVHGGSDSSLVISIGDGDRITIEYFFDGDDDWIIETVKFADGTTWSADRLVELASLPTDGDDHLYGSSGDDTLSGGKGDDVFDGDDGSDTYLFNPGDGNDTIFDPSGSDTIIFGAGITPADVMVNGDDADLVLSIGDGDTVTIQYYFQDSGHDYRIETVEFADGTTWNARRLVELASAPTDGDDVLYGSRGDDTLKAGKGDDVLYGSWGDDTLDGGEGNDEVYGSRGDDTLAGGSGNDSLYGGNGSDTYLFGLGDGSDMISDRSALDRSGNDTIVFGSGIASVDVTVRGGNGDLILSIADSDRITIADFLANSRYRIETVKFADGTSWNADHLLELAFTPTDGNDTIRGSNRDDTLFGGEGDDDLDGGPGYSDDILFGGKGDDRLDGGEGNDTLAGGKGDDYLIGDYVDDRDGSDTYLFNLGDGNDTIFDEYPGGSTVVLGPGIAPGDVKAHLTDSDTLVLSIGGGDSITIAHSFSDQPDWKVEFANGTVWRTDHLLDLASAPTDGNDRIYGYDGDDTLAGGKGADYLDGQTGDDHLYGGEGADTLAGQKGEDMLSGGAGADTFVFRHNDTGKSRKTADTITDFTLNDTIEFEPREFNSDDGFADVKKFDFIGDRAFGGHAGELHFIKAKSDTWIEGDIDGDKKADFVIHLEDAVALSAGNFGLVV